MLLHTPGELSSIALQISTEGLTEKTKQIISTLSLFDLAYLNTEVYELELEYLKRVKSGNMSPESYELLFNKVADIQQYITEVAIPNYQGGN